MFLNTSKNSIEHNNASLENYHPACMPISPNTFVTKHKIRQNSCNNKYQTQWGDISIINPFNQGFLEDEPSFLNNDLLIVRHRNNSSNGNYATNETGIALNLSGA